MSENTGVAIRAISLVLGIIAIIAGLSIPSTPVLIIGMILAAIGGVWILILDLDINPFS